MKALSILSVSALLAFVGITATAAQNASMTFFVTSQGPGDGANLGGLEGADAHCGSLAEAAGVTGKTWAAYLSTSETNARDRIGAGPWVNSKGETIAESVEALHSEQNGITKATALNEKGEQVNGRGDTPNRHDILTGSMPDGTAHEATCENWTANGQGSAMVGHHDRMGLDDSAPAKSWNSSHPSRGCSQTDLQGTGGSGLFYCFATQ
ncbi:hypothetical protein G6N74_20865 [Mesorhizobium sp. CGMCC 1.15528]|uniref:Lectin n=1 Tax=Mesorhizobium zhangyense TaxID=1776730 RepID=A0A7C9VDX8_9HYPH|nr:hypothetical protein [Mesorhizobium zhangyense]NGN43527.1 hypothetical protein [Mesorhizobium zhangyense]